MCTPTGDRHHGLCGDNGLELRWRLSSLSVRSHGVAFPFRCPHLAEDQRPRFPSGKPLGSWEVWRNRSLLLSEKSRLPVCGDELPYTRGSWRDRFDRLGPGRFVLRRSQDAKRCHLCPSLGCRHGQQEAAHYVGCPALPASSFGGPSIVSLRHSRRGSLR